MRASQAKVCEMRKAVRLPNKASPLFLVRAGSLASFVVSLNLHRRHLDESQRGMVAAKLSTRARGGDRKSNNFKVSIETLKQSEAAELLNVSVGTVKRAAKVRNEGTPETIAARCKVKKATLESIALLLLNRGAVFTQPRARLTLRVRLPVPPSHSLVSTIQYMRRRRNTCAAVPNYSHRRRARCT